MNNKPVIQMDDSDIDAADPKLYDCLVGQFIGKNLPFKLVEESLRRAWGPKLVEVMSNGRGVFLLRIVDREFRRSILEGSPITIARIPLILQQWKPGVELNRDTHRSVPVWVRLRNLPFAFWSAQAIGKVASALGKPLYVDQKTEQMSMLTFARVCVEMTTQQPQYETLDLTTNGSKVVVEVEYEWKPMICSKCEMFGHTYKSVSPGPSVGRSEGASESIQKANPVVEAHSSKGKEVVMQHPSVEDVDVQVTQRSKVGATKPVSGVAGDRPSYVGESSSGKAAPQGPDALPDPQSVAEEEGWKQVNRKNKKKKMKQAARKAAAAVATIATDANAVAPADIVQAEVEKLSMMKPNDPSNSLDPVIHSPPRLLSPSIADPPAQDDPLVLIDTSDEISNSSIQEDPIGVDSQVGDIPDSKRLTSPLMASFQENLRMLISDGPEDLKKEVAASRTSKKR